MRRWWSSGEDVAGLLPPKAAQMKPAHFSILTEALPNSLITLSPLRTGQSSKRATNSCQSALTSEESFSSISFLFSLLDLLDEL